jgi:hypothetical protein
MTSFLDILGERIFEKTSIYSTTVEKEKESSGCGRHYTVLHLVCSSSVLLKDCGCIDGGRRGARVHLLPLS